MSSSDLYAHLRNQIMERQHNEKMAQQRSIHYDRMAMQRQAIEERSQAQKEHNLAIVQCEQISGQNALDLARLNLLLDKSRQNGDFVNEVGSSLQGRHRDWSQNIGNAMVNLLQIEANLIANKKLNEQNHEHRIVEMQTSAEIDRLQTILESELKNENLTYQETLQIAVDLLRQSLGLGKNFSDNELLEMADKLARSVYSPY